MQLSQTVSKAIALLSAATAGSIVLSAGMASAQSVNQTVNVDVAPGANVVVVDSKTPGFSGAYIGGGVAAGVTNGGQQGDAANLGGNIQGRIAPFASVPVSARAAVLFGSETTAIMPLVTYDLPIAANTNLYVGGGYSFVEKNGKPSPLGNKNAPVVTVGAETSITRDVVVYGDAKLGVRAYENSKASALSFQAGVGYRF
ncbi:outer membrane beta-barrel protein [Phormidium sp. CLA17]|uniref:outer membrane beta-barrel protein n=1 Tax=Leptolyngbya sp. Cla-17 TaxID=2803751 RepID=UPI0014916967|nr:outer membrane beta-barrel protein [Leptolyngbya sp. Cla-17]MBM0743134.1 outer membrane beta-barrel protein [Leptolyngbya sp. Cla-17]